MRNVHELWENDPTFRDMSRALGYLSPDIAEAVYKGDHVRKSMPDAADLHVAAAITRRPKRRKQLVRKAIPLGAVVGGAAAYGAATTVSPDGQYRKLKRFHATVAPGLAETQLEWNRNRLARKRGKAVKGTYAPQTPEPVTKSIVWKGEISKVDEDKFQVFGWASIVSMNGVPVVDTQGDLIEEGEMEKSAYEYVIKSRKGGDQHKRTDDGQAFHASDLIESFVVTEEKKQKLGLPDDMPVGWWVGFKVNNDDTWRKVKNGEVTGFSIHGRGKREPIDGELTPVGTMRA